MWLNILKATGLWVVWENSKPSPKSVSDGACLVFRCSVFMRLGALESLHVSTSGSLANLLSDFKPQFPHR